MDSKVNMKARISERFRNLFNTPEKEREFVRDFLANPNKYRFEGGNSMRPNNDG